MILDCHIKMELGHDEVDTEKLMWLSIIHVVFIVSGVLMAVMDYINSLSKRNAGG